MTSCRHCESNRVKTRALTDKDLAELGIPVRVSNGAAILTCQSCGAEETVVESMAELISAAAISLAYAPYKLSSEEIVFCRKAMGLTGKKLAKLLDVKPETVSRWENDKQPINDSTERLLRQRVVLALREQTVRLKKQTIDSIVTLPLSPIRRSEDVPNLTYGVGDDIDRKRSDRIEEESGYDILNIANA